MVLKHLRKCVICFNMKMRQVACVQTKNICAIEKMVAVLDFCPQIRKWFADCNYQLVEQGGNLTGNVLSV